MYYVPVLSLLQLALHIEITICSLVKGQTSGICWHPSLRNVLYMAMGQLMKIQLSKYVDVK